MDERELAKLRRREATRAMFRYFVIAFAVVFCLSTLSAYAIVEQRQRRSDIRERRAENTAVLYFVCVQLESLKAQNRADVAEERKNFSRNLAILRVKLTPRILDIAEEGWNRTLLRNKSRNCPYDVTRPGG